MQSFARVIVLFGECLRAPIEERDADGTRRMIGGKGNTRHAARRRRKSTAGQHLHAPVPEALAFDRMRRNVPRSGRLLCRRLRYPQPRSRSGGIGVDEGGDDQARVDDQRGKNFARNEAASAPPCKSGETMSRRPRRNHTPACNRSTGRYQQQRALRLNVWSAETRLRPFN